MAQPLIGGLFETSSPRVWSAAALFKPEARALAVLVMALSFVFPVHGLSVDLCVIHAGTGLPCPGCGLSRGIASITQGHFAHAFAMNPFAFLAWPLFASLTVLTLSPARIRERVKLLSDRASVARVYQFSVLAFALFGVVRFGVYLVLGWRFP